MAITSGAESKSGEENMTATATNTEQPRPQEVDLSSELRIQRILVPIDFTSASRQGLRYAVNLARQFGAKITLIHVVRAARSSEFTRIGILLEGKGHEADAQKELAKMAEQELGREINGGAIVVRGGPPYEIDRAAAELGVDLIVTGTHGYTGVEHFFFGSTTEEIVHNASCPVLTIRQPLVPVRFPDDDECVFKRILAPVSLTTRSGGALGYAAALARRCDGEVVLLYAAHADSGRSFARQQAIAPSRQLEILRERLVSAGIKASLEVCCGKPSREIADCAWQQKADLIVVNSHSQVGLWTYFGRGTAERVVRRATCPVLVVRSDGWKRTWNVPRKDESMAKAA